jgi:hypothetical protein
MITLSPILVFGHEAFHGADIELRSVMLYVQTPTVTVRVSAVSLPNQVTRSLFPLLLLRFEWFPKIDYYYY